MDASGAWLPLGVAPTVTRRQVGGRKVEWCFCLWLNKLGEAAVSYDPKPLLLRERDSLTWGLSYSLHHR